jgi:hydroxymethylpyrimidine kinase/phosphomethylpyrimidine kinase
MLGSRENLAAVSRILGAHPGLPRVVDPVLRSTSGFRLLEARGAAEFLRLLRGSASLLTPNLDEASALAGLRVGSVEAMKEAARRIAGECGVPCLVKGGHLRGEVADVLHDGRELSVFRHRRLRRSVHGTGCFLSAAILGYLADGLGLEEACGRGIALTARSIGRSVAAGRGRRVFGVIP